MRISASVVLLLAFILEGCAVPLQIASYAIDALSVLATDKTVADHALSYATERDCSFARGLIALDAEVVCLESNFVQTDKGE